MMSLTYYVSANFCLNFFKVLPSLTRVKGLQVPGGAFADLLMLQEFVHNFGEALDLGKRTEFTFEFSLIILSILFIVNWSNSGDFLVFC